MSQRYYSVIIGKDNYITNILNEDDAIEFGRPEGTIEPTYVSKLKGDVLILENIVMLVPKEKGYGIIVFEDLPFGAEYVTVPINAVTQIYLIKENLASTVRAALSGIELPK